MSSLHGTIHRYQLIIEKLERGRYPSARDILDSLHEQGFEIAKRTLERDFDKLRFEFGIDITFERSRKGYVIPKESREQTDQFLRLAQYSQLMGLQAKRGDDKDRLDLLQFESRSDLKGMEYLPRLLEAAKQRQLIRIEHKSYYRDQASEYNVRPYFLKEYKNRWYVVGWAEDRSEFRSFGVDRIKAVEELDQYFDRSEHNDPADFFEEIVGVTYSLSKLQKIVLSFDPYQGKYIKSLPLHHSQVVLEDNDKELRIRLELRPNFEFQQILLGYGDKVKVHKPKWLADEIADIQRKAADQYQ